jgi:hypothetical protein
MTKRWLVPVLCAAVTACGAGSHPGNAAAPKDFTYGAPTPASAQQVAAAQLPLTSALDMLGSPDAGNAAALANLTGIITQLLGNPTAGLSSGLDLSQLAVLATAWSGVAGDMSPLFAALDSGCVEKTSKGVTFKGCEVVFSQPLVYCSATIDGSFSASDGALQWDLTVQGCLDITAPLVTGSGSFSVHEAGSLGLGAGACKGAILSEVALDLVMGGKPVALGVSNSLDLDIAFQPTQLCAIGGTLVAKRVWSDRPLGQTADSLPDTSMKITWSACGAADVALGTAPPVP